MIRKDVSLLLDIENAYEAINLNLEAISHTQMLIGTGSAPVNLALHLAYLCELDANANLKAMKGAIDELRQYL